jgi:Autographiviridae endonuclease VII
MNRREYKLFTKYGIKEADFDQMLREQKGRCALCKTEEPGGRHNVFNVDHCHQTGRVRGLLCDRCNRYLGRLGDNRDDALVNYLTGRRPETMGSNIQARRGL